VRNYENIENTNPKLLPHVHLCNIRNLNVHGNSTKTQYYPRNHEQTMDLVLNHFYHRLYHHLHREILYTNET